MLVTLEGITTEVRLAQPENAEDAMLVTPSEMVVIITLQLRIGDTEGIMNICIPYLVLEPIMSKLTTTFWVASSISKSDSEKGWQNGRKETTCLSYSLWFFNRLIA